MLAVRKPAVAGSFYPNDPKELHNIVLDFLEQAKEDVIPPKAIIAPHAGYIYSGSVAAEAYSSIKKVASTIKQVILLGPAHRVGFKGVAAPSVECFESPLGQVRLNRQAIKAILNLPQVIEFDEAHREEHSLEVHIPFLQEILNDFVLVPLVVGDANPLEVSEVLELLWGGPETLIVISSDLSHYHDYETAMAMDANTSAAIMDKSLSIGPQDACGSRPIKGLLNTATKLGINGTIIDVKNSGDTAGTKDRVVGYGAYHFGALDMSDMGYSPDHQKALLKLARNSIIYGAEHGSPMPQFTFPKEFNIRIPIASFVTLNKDGALRGCVGSLQAHRPLPLDVMHNAFKAAFNDFRFAPVLKEEIDDLEIHISVLSAPAPMKFESEEDLISQLRPGVDGLILSDGNNRGTFLPSVWESLKTPEEFFTQLKRKASLPPDHWSDTVQVMRYTAEYFGEEK